jgi:hypothetical protein
LSPGSPPTESITWPPAAIPVRSVSNADALPPYVRLIHDVLLGDRSQRAGMNWAPDRL